MIGRYVETSAYIRLYAMIPSPRSFNETKQTAAAQVAPLGSVTRWRKKSLMSWMGCCILISESTRINKLPIKHSGASI